MYGLEEAVDGGEELVEREVRRGVEELDEKLELAGRGGGPREERAEEVQRRLEVRGGR